MANSPVGASSATYRKAVNKVADAIGVDPTHTKYPSEDFSDIIDEIPEAIRAKAIEWYRRGIIRGMKKATDLMAEGKIYEKGSSIYAPNKMEVSTKIKFSGGSWESHEFIVKSTDIGFE